MDPAAALTPLEIILKYPGPWLCVILPMIARKLTTGKVIGMDLSTGMLDKAKENIPEELRDRVDV